MLKVQGVKDPLKFAGAVVLALSQDWENLREGCPLLQSESQESADALQAMRCLSEANTVQKKLGASVEAILWAMRLELAS